MLGSECPGPRWAAWPRRILANNLADAISARSRAKCDSARDVSPDSALADSSVRIGLWVAAPGPTPVQEADRHESVADPRDEVLAHIAYSARTRAKLYTWT